ncbi:putative sulfate exporter family transporter [Sphingopyxis sp. BSN-002]|uniref:YeiH family protein n=1 Tax=Sphingopyxis sp. BSN-002 TaxID=2911495 RepID=UPI001EDB3233|nr:putative sulfate exporter family transporter [Sphingopyxis sp. BSN-002]UKK83074.1 putative sulfate exporter family transporter [Sphingopyxis sp. BSN-002]
MRASDYDWPMAADLYGEMQLEAAPPAKRKWRDYLPGAFVTAIAALAAAWLADHYAAPIVLMGLLIGLSMSFLSQDKRTHAGLDLMSQTALRIGIVLVGARITAAQLAELGPLPFALLVLIMIAVIVVTVATARLFAQEKHAALLAGGATAICGASAALALYSLIGDKRVDQARFTLTLVGITVASALAMTLYPVLAAQLHLTDAQAGFLIGASIHDVAQAIGGGFSFSPQAGEVATIVKLTRVALLAPMLMLVALWLGRSGEPGATRRIPLRLPWFILGFLAVAAVNSLVPIPKPMQSVAATGAQALLLLAIVATAMKARLHLLLDQGWRSFAPIVIATLTSFLLSLAAALAL